MSLEKPNQNNPNKDKSKPQKETIKENYGLLEQFKADIEKYFPSFGTDIEVIRDVDKKVEYMYMECEDDCNKVKSVTYENGIYNAFNVDGEIVATEDTMTKLFLTTQNGEEVAKSKSNEHSKVGNFNNQEIEEVDEYISPHEKHLKERFEAFKENISKEFEYFNRFNIVDKDNVKVFVAVDMGTFNAISFYPLSNEYTLYISATQEIQKGDSLDDIYKLYSKRIEKMQIDYTREKLEKDWEK